MEMIVKAIENDETYPNMRANYAYDLIQPEFEYKQEMRSPFWTAPFYYYAGHEQNQPIRRQPIRRQPTRKQPIRHQPIKHQPIEHQPTETFQPIEHHVPTRYAGNY